jgi:hypothetical protein
MMTMTYYCLWRSAFLSFLLLGVAVHGQNFDNMFGGGKDCEDYRCPKNGGVVVPKAASTVKFTSTGCQGMQGSMGMHMMQTNGDGDDGASPVESCCDQWHACYQVCGASKKQCDEAFDKCSKQACAVSPDEADCTQKANLLTLMTKMGGCQDYTAAQYKACDCVRSDAKVDARRTDVIRAFYEQVVVASSSSNNEDDTAKKAKDLAQKATTPKKMAALMRKLIAKYYPDSIQKVQDTTRNAQQERMRQMLNNDNPKPKDIPEDTLVDEEEEEETDNETMEL